MDIFGIMMLIVLVGLSLVLIVMIITPFIKALAKALKYKAELFIEVEKENCKKESDFRKDYLKQLREKKEELKTTKLNIKLEKLNEKLNKLNKVELEPELEVIKEEVVVEEEIVDKLVLLPEEIIFDEEPVEELKLEEPKEE